MNTENKNISSKKCSIVTTYTNSFTNQELEGEWGEREQLQNRSGRGGEILHFPPKETKAAGVKGRWGGDIKTRYVVLGKDEIR